MTARGVHFALSPEDEARVRAARGDDELLELIEDDLEEQWDEAWLLESDKDWDAIERCLALDAAEDDPRSMAILGGEQLHRGEEYIVCLVATEDVRLVAQALEAIDATWLRARYDRLPTTDYSGPWGDDDFAAIWETFVAIRALFLEAGRAGRAMLFTAAA